MKKREAKHRKLTQSVVLALRSSGKRELIWDSKTSGLGVALEPSGRRSYFWFRKVKGEGRWKTIGPVEDVTMDDARGQADEMNARVAHDENPFVRRDGVKLSDAYDQYKERALPKSRHVKDLEKARERVDWIWDKYLKPWAARPLISITRQDCRDLHDRLGARVNRRGNKAYYGANRALELLRAILNYAIEQELLAGENPAMNIDPFPETERDRFVTGDEMPALWRELRATPNLDLRDYVLLDLYTGTRKRDLLSARWENIDLDRGLWYVPEPKNKKPYVVPLTREAAMVLADRRRRIPPPTPWVFPNPRSSTGHVLDLKKSWSTLRIRAGIPDVRQHDLRRTYGSYQAIAGASLPVIGASLGHARSLGATSIYARLSTDPIRESVMNGTQLMLKAARKRVRR